MQRWALAVLAVVVSAPGWCQPVLRSNASVISIEDGGFLQQHYWTLDPAARPDTYTADPARRSKTVRFLTDVDTLGFDLEPGAVHDFVILLNGTDSCYTRLRSANTTEPWATAPPDTIPFTLNGSNVLTVPVVVDDRDTLQLMLHTGMEGVTLTTEAAQRLRGFIPTDTVHAGSWGGGGSSVRSDDHRVRIGQRVQMHLPLEADPLSGKGSDGKVGHDLFGDAVVEVDFDHARSVVHRGKVPATDGYVPFLLEHHRGGLYITCHVEDGQGGVVAQRFLMHTGYGRSVILGATALSRQVALSKLDTLGVDVVYDSFGNELRNRRVRLPALHVGAHRFAAVPASVMDARVASSTNVLGMEVLKRFNWLLDLRHDTLYLRPNGMYGAPWP